LVAKGCIQTLSRLVRNICHKHYIPHPSFPEDTTVLSLLESNNTPNTAQNEVKHCCLKSADVDTYVRVGQKSVVLAEIVLLCVRTLHHFKTPRHTPEEMTVIYFISTLMSSNKHQKYGEMWLSMKQMEKKKVL